MGVVKRQSLKASVVSYAGAALGMISVLFIMPYCLNTEQLGLLRLINDGAGFFGMFSLFGSSYAVLYFFPRYEKDEKRLNGFLSYELAISLAGFILVTALLLIGKTTIINIYSKNAAPLLDYLYILPAMILFA